MLRHLTSIALILCAASAACEDTYIPREALPWDGGIARDIARPPRPDVATDTSVDTAGDAGCLTLSEPRGDADGDGLSNAVEDSDADCVVSVGETDPLDADTDGDGLRDGVEDLNTNGRVDPCELDPRLVDSDGDGVRDGDTGLARYLEERSREPLRLLSAGASSLALDPARFTTEPIEIEDGVRLNSERHYGFYVELPRDARPVQDAFEARLAATGLRFTTLDGSGGVSWSLDDPTFPQASEPAARAILALSVGPSSLNPQIEPDQDLAGVRDWILGGILRGAVPTSSVVGTRCAGDIRMGLVAFERGELRILAGLLTCAADFDVEAETLTRDLLSTHLIADAITPVARTMCPVSTPPPSRPLDILWVIDNSGSMAAEQRALIEDARPVLDARLFNERVDWRMAVTTTESYSLDESLLGINLDHDELLDLDTGLRRPGFFRGDGRFEERFTTLITLDEGCTRNDLFEPPGFNICGDGRESGLKSSGTVLFRALAEARDAYRLRDEAARLVVWFSDEEDQSFKTDDPTEPMAPTDPRRQDILLPLLERHLAVGLTGCAIVGDPTVASTGTCETLDPNGVDGAQYGRGYIDLARRTGGIYGSLCQEALSGVLDRCLLQVFGEVPDAELGARVAIPQTIRVLIDGESVPRSDTAGWVYHPQANSISLHGLEVSADARLEVFYRTWGP